MCLRRGPGLGIWGGADGSPRRNPPHDGAGRHTGAGAGQADRTALRHHLIHDLRFHGLQALWCWSAWGTWRRPRAVSVRGVEP